MSEQEQAATAGAGAVYGAQWDVVESPVWRSNEIAELAAALAAAQGKITNAAKDSRNPFFNSKYADLAAVWDACRAPLAENGLSVTQHPTMTFKGEPQLVVVAKERGGERVNVRCIMQVTLHTRLLHKSGQWLESTLQSLLPSADPQTVGSALTYLRRYGLSAMVGVAADEDDDGNAASGRDDEHDQRPAAERRPAPRPSAPAPPPKPKLPEGAKPEQIVVAHEVAKTGNRPDGAPYALHRLTTADGRSCYYFSYDWADLPPVADKFVKEQTPVEIRTEERVTPSGAKMRMLAEIVPVGTGELHEPEAPTAEPANELPAEPIRDPEPERAMAPRPVPDDDIPF